MPDFFAPYEGSEPFVFVSYAHKDTDIVLPIIRGLHDRGVRVWYDGGVEVGNEWPEYIAEHLAKSFCVVGFVSRNFGDSHNCRREINFAIEERKEPIVIYMESKSLLSPGMRMQLGSLHALFYDRYPNLEVFLDALTRAEIVKPCIGAPEVEIHSDPQPIPFATIDFADEGRTLRTASEVLPAENISHNKAEELEELYTRAERLYNEGAYMEAVVLFRKVAEQGHAGAQHFLGCSYYHGDGVPQDKMEAVKLFRKAAEQGHADAQWFLGYCYYQDKDVPQDKKEAVKWFRMAAEQGHALAQRNMGYFYEHGKVVPRNIKVALEWYRKAGANEGIARCEKALKKPWWKK